jgi:hypothetical protein
MGARTAGSNPPSPPLPNSETQVSSIYIDGPRISTWMPSGTLSAACDPFFSKIYLATRVLRCSESFSSSSSSRAPSLGENGPIEVPAARVAPIIGEAVKRLSDRQARPRRAFRVSCRGSVHVTGSAGRSAISRFISAELSDLPCASSASDRVTPPPSARVMTKFSAPSCGSS